MVMLRGEKYAVWHGERDEKKKVLEAGGDSAETDRMEGGEMRSAESQTEARLKLQAETA